MLTKANVFLREILSKVYSSKNWQKLLPAFISTFPVQCKIKNWKLNDRAKFESSIPWTLMSRLLKVHLCEYMAIEIGFWFIWTLLNMWKIQSLCHHDSDFRFNSFVHRYAVSYWRKNCEERSRLLRCRCNWITIQVNVNYESPLIVSRRCFTFNRLQKVFHLFIT